jgi:hypothetical protein
LKNFLYYFIENIVNSFCVHPFSFFNAHDSKVCSFDGVAYFFQSWFVWLKLFSFSLNFHFIFKFWDSVFCLV